MSRGSVISSFAAHVARTLGISPPVDETLPSPSSRSRKQSFSATAPYAMCGCGAKKCDHGCPSRTQLETYAWESERLRESLAIVHIELGDSAADLTEAKARLAAQKERIEHLEMRIREHESGVRMRTIDDDEPTQRIAIGVVQ